MTILTGPMFSCAALVPAIQNLGVNLGFDAFVKLEVVCLVIGCFALVLRRQHLVIDLERGTYDHWYGLGVSFRHTRGKLSSLKDVWLSGEHGGYCVALNVGPAAIVIETYGDFKKAFAEAEFLAKALNLCVVNATGDEEIVRPPEHLHETLREYRRRTAQSGQDLPEQPAEMKSAFRRSASSVVIEIPPPRFSKGWIAGATLLVVIAFVICGVVAFELRKPVWGPGGKAFLIVAGVPVLVLFVALVISVISKRVYGSVVVTASPTELLVEYGSILGFDPKTIPADELQNLSIATAKDVDKAIVIRSEKAIIARSDNLTLAFGRNLPEAEQKWLKQAIASAMD